MSGIKSYPETLSKVSKLSNRYVHQRFSVGQFVKVKVSNGQNCPKHSEWTGRVFGQLDTLDTLRKSKCPTRKVLIQATIGQFGHFGQSKSPDSSRFSGGGE